MRTETRTVTGATWMEWQLFLASDMDEQSRDAVQYLTKLPAHHLFQALDCARLLGRDGLPYAGEPVHGYFGLTYANYKVMARSLLQSMPLWWQTMFVVLMHYADDVVPDDGPAGFRVHAVDERGKFTRDPYADYQRGRRRVELREAHHLHRQADDQTGGAACLTR